MTDKETGKAYWVLSTDNPAEEFLEAIKGKAERKALPLELELVEMPQDANFQEVAKYHHFKEDFPYHLVVRIRANGFSNLETGELSYEIDNPGCHDKGPIARYFRFKGKDIIICQADERLLKVRDLYINWGDIEEARDLVDGESAEATLEEAYHLRKGE